MAVSRDWSNPNHDFSLCNYTTHATFTARFSSRLRFGAGKHKQAKLRSLSRTVTRPVCVWTTLLLQAWNVCLESHFSGTWLSPAFRCDHMQVGVVFKSLVPGFFFLFSFTSRKLSIFSKLLKSLNFWQLNKYTYNTFYSILLQITIAIFSYSFTSWCGTEWRCWCVIDVCRKLSAS